MQSKQEETHEKTSSSDGKQGKYSRNRRRNNQRKRKRNSNGRKKQQVKGDPENPSKPQFIKLNSLTLKSSGFNTVVKIVEVNTSEKTDRNRKVYAFYECLIADDTGCFQLALPDFNDSYKDLLVVDKFIAIRNAKVYKNKSSGLKTCTIDRWGKITSEETATFEDINVTENHSIIKTQPEKVKPKKGYKFLRQLSRRTQGFTCQVKLIEVNALDKVDRDGKGYKQFECLVADQTGCFQLGLPDFRVKGEFLEADNVITLRNAKCFKDRQTGLLKITIDQWGKVVHDTEDKIEEVNLENNFSLPKPKPEKKPEVEEVDVKEEKPQKEEKEEEPKETLEVEVVETEK